MHVEPSTINIHTEDIEGETALHKACVWGDIRAVKLLLKAGSKIDTPGDMECTPLYFAVMFGFPDIAKFLLAKGANPDTRSEFGDTPRELAQTKGLASLFSNAKDR